MQHTDSIVSVNKNHATATQRISNSKLVCHIEALVGKALLSSCIPFSVKAVADIAANNSLFFSPLKMVLFQRNSTAKWRFNTHAIQTRDSKDCSESEFVFPFSVCSLTHLRSNDDIILCIRKHLTSIWCDLDVDGKSIDFNAFRKHKVVASNKQHRHRPTQISYC